MLSTILLSGSTRLKKAKLGVVRRIAPFRRTKTVLLDDVEIALKEAKTCQVQVPSIPNPEVTPDLAPAKSQVIEKGIEPRCVLTCQNAECRIRLAFPARGLLSSKELRVICPVCGHACESGVGTDVLVVDFSEWFADRFVAPEIISIPVDLSSPRRAGKSYVKTESETAQPELFPSEESDEQCTHGLRKRWCSICKQRERQSRERSHVLDPFDLVFPILQPPLGEAFDSAIAFSDGQALYGFQRDGVKFLVEHDQALLADEMGLGKSIQTIVALRFLFRLGKVTKGLILCPRSVLTDWERKLWEWAPELRVVKVRGSRQQRPLLWSTPAHVYLTNYETLAGDLPTTLRKNGGTKDIAPTRFDFLVLDEVQKTKNPTTDNAKAARAVAAPIRWGLSGTPLENRLDDVISIFACLKPGLLHYKDAGTPGRVVSAIQPYVLRRRKAEALPELPEKFYEEKWLELSPAQRDAYDRAEREGIIDLNERGDCATVQHVLALITALKQICNMDPVTHESCKLDYLEEMLEEVSDLGDKALVFSQYPQKTLKFLTPQLQRFGPEVFDGTLSDSQRDAVVQRFQEDEQSKVLLVSVRAGGLGLTLTRANYVFHFDLWWNPAVAAQAEDRAHRIGQHKTVFVTYLFAADTIEEKIHRLLLRKRRLFDSVIDSLSDTNLERVLTEDELFGLFGVHRGKPTTESRPTSGPGSPGSLAALSPQGFEQLVADLFSAMGYQVRLTPQSRDQGVDVYAKRISASGTESLAIQCKHYLNRVVGVEHARALYGVVHAQQSITRGVLVTSGDFSRECREFAQGKRIDLYDCGYLCGLLAKHGWPQPQDGSQRQRCNGD